jgi:phage terminase large subunit
MKLQLPKYAKALFEKKRFKVLYGGRGSSKSYTIARILLLEGFRRRIRVLCAREFQNSISESVHFLLVQEINALGLSGNYNITNSSISGINGTEFIFKGVRHNVQSIKSMTGLTHLWIEEAQTISQASWDVLTPTIREPESEIWLSFNPDGEDDPVYSMFITKEGEPIQRDDAVTIKVNWMDNPFFPDVLRKEKEYLYSVNPELADHIWGGKCRTHSDAQIFKHKWVVRDFEPDATMDGPYFGADWGFSVDPTTLVKVYVNRTNRELLIRYAEFGYGVELDDIPKMFDKVPQSRQFLIRADSARPETISYVGRKGFNITAVDKWKGSVEDGVEWLKSFEKIVIHPSCEKMIQEAKNYSYKVDRLTQDVQVEIVDAYNHGWDAVRYAYDPLIQAGSASILSVL